MPSRVGFTKKISLVFDQILGAFMFLGSAILAFLLLAVCWDVFARTFFGRPLTWVLEFTEYGLLYMTFLCTAWVLKNEGHVISDLLLVGLSPRNQALLNTVTSFMGAVICLILTWFGADVSWGAGGAYSSKLIGDMRDYREYLKFDKNNRYYKMQIDYVKYLSKRSKGKFGFTEMITIDGLNFLDCVRHGDAYTDIYDYPVEIKEVMAFASDLNVKLVKEQRKYIDVYRGGRFNFYQIWTPIIENLQTSQLHILALDINPIIRNSISGRSS